MKNSCKPTNFSKPSAKSTMLLISQQGYLKTKSGLKNLMSGLLRSPKHPPYSSHSVYGYLGDQNLRTAKPSEWIIKTLRRVHKPIAGVQNLM